MYKKKKNVLLSFSQLLFESMNSFCVEHFCFQVMPGLYCCYGKENSLFLLFKDLSLTWFLGPLISLASYSNRLLLFLPVYSQPEGAAEHNRRGQSPSDLGCEWTGKTLLQGRCAPHPVWWVSSVLSLQSTGSKDSIKREINTKGKYGDFHYEHLILYSTENSESLL